MLGPSLLLVTLASMAAPDADALAVRQDRPLAIWVEPELIGLLGSDTGVLPLGLELGGQITPRVLLSLALARLPAANVERNEVMLGGRFYLDTRAWAPYLVTVTGWMRAGVDDTGGLSETHWFAAAGLGEELALRGGFSLTGDILIGPDRVTDARDSSQKTWHASSWLRLGVGYRF
jgi:hypothetical protein